MTGSRRPVVGICAAFDPAAWTVWREVEANVSPRNYSLALRRRRRAADRCSRRTRVGSEAPDEVLDLVDALILAGGADIDPSLYGAERQPETTGDQPERDRFEFALAAPRAGAGPAATRHLPRAWRS